LSSLIENEYFSILLRNLPPKREERQGRSGLRFRHDAKNARGPVPGTAEAPTVRGD
jgi:hypothetical protein